MRSSVHHQQGGISGLQCLGLWVCGKGAGDFALEVRKLGEFASKEVATLSSFEVMPSWVRVTAPGSS